MPCRHPRFTLHFTPTGSSWLNLVERWFGEFTAQKIKRGAHRSVPALEADIRDWIEHWNQDPTPYIWHKTAAEILDSLADYSAASVVPRTNETGHLVCVWVRRGGTTV